MDYPEDKFDGTSTTRLCALTLKFDTYKMHLYQKMKQYFRMMSTIIYKLKVARIDLIDEQ